MKSLFLITLVSIFISGCATSTHRTVSKNVRAIVKSSNPAPELCYEKNRNSGKKTLLGVALGAAIGNQIGSGNGRALATLTGAVIGAGIARSDIKGNENRYDCKRDGYENLIVFMNPFSNSMEYKTIKTNYRKSVGTAIIFKHKEDILINENSD